MEGHDIVGLMSVALEYECKLPVSFYLRPPKKTFPCQHLHTYMGAINID
jgi:hypothetical protein